MLLKGLDEIGISLEHAADIAAFEKAHPIAAPAYESLDVKYSINGR